MNPGKILNSICEAYSVTPEQIEGRSRTGLIAEARNVYFWFLIKELGFNPNDAGLMARRNRKTAAQAMRNINNQQKIYPVLKRRIDEIKNQCWRTDNDSVQPPISPLNYARPDSVNQPLSGVLFREFGPISNELENQILIAAQETTLRQAKWAKGETVKIEINPESIRLIIDFCRAKIHSGSAYLDISLAMKDLENEIYCTIQK